MAAYHEQYSLNLETGELVNEIKTAVGNTLTYAGDYVERYSDRSYVSYDSTQNEINVTKLKIEQINSLKERLESLEKKVFGDYQSQKIQNKLDGSLDFENDVALFFQHDLNRKEWQKFFNDMKINATAKELFTISEKYSAPKKK
jgi:hypothetical protein